MAMKVKDLIEKNNFRLIKNFYYPLFHYKDMLFFNQTYDIWIII